VDWDTTAKTASFTAVSGNGYFVNTTSGAVTMTLPATPSAGDIVSVKDYAYTFATNSLTVNRNGSPIGGGTAFNTIDYNTNGSFLTFIYVDGTQGWLLTNDSDNTSELTTNYIAATGGTITTCGNYKIHTFTGPGTFTICCIGPLSNSKVDYVVVAGGGAGGTMRTPGCGNFGGAGGGGAGGFRESKCATTSGPYTASPLSTPTSLPISVTSYPITVGAGAAATTVPAPNDGGTGSNSIFSTITSTGGGNGGDGVRDTISLRGGVSGGSGGGAGSGGPAATGSASGGSGNTPPVSPPQGNGGASTSSGDRQGPGGGGASGSGTNPNASTPHTSFLPSGGDGVSTSITGSPVTRAGGGGGGGALSTATYSGGSGGGGPGGDNDNVTAGTDGTANTGSGGGGAGDGTGNCGLSGAGGSGVVIIRYRYQ
jgi:hypothetical protein